MSNEVTITSSNQLATTTDDLPDYLKTTKAGGGLEGLGSGDFVLPRIKILQPLSPECKTFPGVALPGMFWHTAASESLGQSVKMVVCAAHKRVAVWSARSGANSELLAWSADGVSWSMGGNQEFEFTPDVKNQRRKIKFHTRNNVAQSKLLEWGTSDPENIKSGPLATLIYEYLCYIPDRPDLSPVMFGMYRTGAQNAKNLNTQLLMVRQQGRPITSASVTAFIVEENNDQGEWFVPNFKRSGWVVESAYIDATRIQTEYAKHTADYKEEVATQTTVKDDEIPF